MTGTDLVVAQELSPADLTAFLQQSGWAEKSSGETVLRMKMDGNMITTPQGDMFMYNPAKPQIPAFVARIVRPPEEYWAIFLSEANANLIGRPELGNQFSKKYIVADASRRVWDSDLAFDEIKSHHELLDNFGKPLKAAWKADILLQVVPESGQLTGDEPIYTLTLSTTSVIEFKGTSRAPEAGVVSEYNFIQKLCRFAMAEAKTSDKVLLQQAVTAALTSLTLGGVVAEVRTKRAENKDAGTNWTVVSFDPIHIEPMFEGDLLLSGDEA